MAFHAPGDVGSLFHFLDTRDHPRLLRIGRLMRRLNVDEVPQFWNVLCGEMSLVGHRPERPAHAASFQEQIPQYSKRCAAKPGMTGWAQVHGFRGATSLKARVRCDLFYLEHCRGASKPGEIL